MTTPRLLSPAAQAVLDAAGQVPVPNGLAFPLIRLEIAAAIRALVEQAVPEEQLHPPFDVPVWPERARARRDLNLAIWARQEVRTKQLAIAAELDGGAGQPTSTENHDD